MPLTSDNLLKAVTNDHPDDTQCIVRLRTTAWSDRRGVHFKKSLTYLRKQSIGVDLLGLEAETGGPAEALLSIVNLTSCKDGVYKLVTCNESRDWESGYIDSWDYKLIPVA